MSLSLLHHVLGIDVYMHVGLETLFIASPQVRCGKVPFAQEGGQCLCQNEPYATKVVSTYS